MAYNTKNILTGERPYDVLRAVAESAEGSYGSKVAEDLDIKQQSASEILRNLRDRGLVKEGKRTKAQYYEIDSGGFTELFMDLVEDEVLEGSSTDRDEVEDLLDAKKKMYEEFGDYSIDKAIQRDFPVFYEFYIGHYLTSVETSTIREMVLDDFFDGVLMHETAGSEPPGWFFYIKALAKQYQGYAEDPASMIVAALIEYEQLPDTIEKKNTYVIDPEEKTVLYDVDITKSGYQCSNCGEEFEDFESGAKSPCGCGVIKSQADLETVNLDMLESWADIEGVTNLPTDDLKEMLKVIRTIPSEEEAFYAEASESIDYESIEDMKKSIEDELRDRSELEETPD